MRKKISTHVHRRYYHMGRYRYIFYGYVLEKLFQSHNSNIVLDAGCGKKGSLLIPIDNLVGVDVLRSNIKYIHKTRQGDFVVASLGNLPFKHQVFDNVICIDVLEHVEKKDQVFKEINRVSQPNASFLGSMSNQLNPFMLLDSWLPILSVTLIKYIGAYYERHSRLNLKTLTNTMRRCGFDIHISFLGHPQFNPWLYEYTNSKVPWYGHLWVLIDKFTDHIKILKEILIFEATKRVDLDSS
jgi:ubiquinone/menaquinone biosynthesis C-methylase UbiE